MPESATLPFLVTGESPGDVGQIEKALADAGQPPPRFVDRWNGPDVTFSPGDFAGLIILGDSRDWAASKVYEPDRARFAAAMRNGKPVLGICYGAQLIAAYLAGIISQKPLAGKANKGHAGNIFPVEVRGQGLTDPVMAPLRRSPLAIMSHLDSFQEPPGGTGLAWSTGKETPEHCEAFRVGSPEDAVYGLQFHPEPTLEMLQRQDDPWFFGTAPDLDRQMAAVTTGLEVLRAWVKLAVGQVV